MNELPGNFQLKGKNPLRVTLPLPKLLILKTTPLHFHHFKKQSLQILSWYCFRYYYEDSFFQVVIVIRGDSQFIQH